MATISGQKVVTTAGTAVLLSVLQEARCSVMVKALPTNTDLVYVGKADGDVSSANGMPLDAGEVVVFDYIDNLNEVWIDSAVNGEGVAWLLLRV